VVDELHRREPNGGEQEPSAGVPSTATSTWSRLLRLVLGWLLIALGIVGLFVPILQGVLLISLGLLVLSRESPALRRFGRRLGDRFPFLRRLHDRVQRRAETGEEEAARGAREEEPEE